MPKVKVTKRYNDLILGGIQVPGTVLEVTDERAKKLVEHGKAELLKEDQRKKISDKEKITD